MCSRLNVTNASVLFRINAPIVCINNVSTTKRQLHPIHTVHVMVWLTIPSLYQVKLKPSSIYMVIAYAAGPYYVSMLRSDCSHKTILLWSLFTVRNWQCGSLPYSLFIALYSQPCCHSEQLLYSLLTIGITCIQQEFISSKEVNRGIFVSQVLLAFSCPHVERRYSMVNWLCGV